MSQLWRRSRRRLGGPAHSPLAAARAALPQGFTRWGWGNGSRPYKLTLVEGAPPRQWDRAQLLEQVRAQRLARAPRLPPRPTHRAPLRPCPPPPAGPADARDLRLVRARTRRPARRVQPAPAAPPGCPAAPCAPACPRHRHLHTRPGQRAWCPAARAPPSASPPARRAGDWFSLYLGKANRLRERLKDYINSDGRRLFGARRRAAGWPARAAARPPARPPRGAASRAGAPRRCPQARLVPGRSTSR